MAQGAEEPPVACRKFPGRAHHSKLKAHEQNHHEQNFVPCSALAVFICGIILHKSFELDASFACALDAVP